MAGAVGERVMPILRGLGLTPDLRRARLLAARGYRPGTIPRHAILNGHWDAGSVVRDKLPLPESHKPE